MKNPQKSDTKNTYASIHVRLFQSELDEIDAWQNRQSITTRSEAIRQLFRIAFATEQQENEPTVYGVSEKPKQHFLVPQRSNIAPIPTKGVDLSDKDIERIAERVLAMLAEAGGNPDN